MPHLHPHFYPHPLLSQTECRHAFRIFRTEVDLNEGRCVKKKRSAPV